jgi:hypothetical protein
LTLLILLDFDADQCLREYSLQHFFPYKTPHNHIHYIKFIPLLL